MVLGTDGGIVLQDYAPDENVTHSIWNESTPLANDMRTTLSEKIKRDSWNHADDSSEDLALEDDLRLFADQIDSKAREIISNATVLLENFELYPSSSATFDFNGLDGVTMLGDFSQFNESHQTSFLNLSFTDGEDWLQDVQNEVSIIESWEVEANKLSLIALAAFQNLKSNTTNIMQNAILEAQSTLESNTADMYHGIQARQVEMKQLQKEQHHHSDDQLFLDETWEAGGFSIEGEIPSATALEKISSIPLKTYKLRDDKQRDLGVNKGERRTRFHVGVTDLKDGDVRAEPTSIFSYNIGAVSQLASLLDQLYSKITTTSAFFRHQSSLEDKVSEMKTQTENQRHDTFKSPSQLASEVAALETEVALTRIARLAQSVIQSARVNSIKSRFISRLKSELLKGQSSERVGMIERDCVSARENHADDSEAYLDRLLIQFETLDKMDTAWNSTRRELLEMNKEAHIEAHVAKEEINAEATVERENEATSLEQIKAVGKARMEEVIDAIENLFWHLAGCMQHIMTPEGRQQFLFYVGSAGVLVFVISTMKELIALGCICVLRFFTAPRLVREYGNLRVKASWSAKNNEAMQEIVLPSKIKERIDTIVKVADAASKRRFPLRSVLIHGSPGTGKSVVAKAIAQSIPSLPYALMSGADVFPMGSQGPAELRRLLTWASNKRHGGVIIIDEAEVALGSRAKTRSDNGGSDRTVDNNGTSSSTGFSRDSLNVLLSMTGTFGNIMLILTTSNPSDLDEAVLDRMDDTIELPLPSAEERSILLRNRFVRQFELEDDTQTSVVDRFWSWIRKAPTKARFHHSFGMESCLSNLSTDSNTKGFSGRELEKLIQGIAHKTFASDSGVLDTTLWDNQARKLTKAAAAKHRLFKN